MKAVARLLVSIPDCIESTAVKKYARYIHGLLGGQLSDLQVTTLDYTLSNEQAAVDRDLFIIGEPKLSVIGRLLAGSPFRRAVTQTLVSSLVVLQPRWPIQNILLIIRVEKTDEAAVDWAGRLAQASDANVSILPILPSFPHVYAPASSEETTLGELLSPNTQLGQHLRCLSQRLAQWQIASTLHIRQGESAWQIHWEVMSGNYDLVVIGSEPHGSWRRLLLGELVGSMLGWLNRPLLVAQPGQRAQFAVGDCGND
jgi:nucleotide-binding universal stress UspA family protein